MSLKKINYIVIPSTILLLAFRILHILVGIDNATGFSKASIYDFILYTVLGAILLFLIFKLYYSRISLFVNENKPSKLVCYSVIIFACYCEFMSVISLITGSKVPFTDNSNLQLIRTIETISAIFGILVGICLVFEAVKAISTSSFKSPSLLSSIVVILYFITLLFTYYAVHNTIVTISQNLIGLFFWMSATIFVYAYLRYLSRSKTAKSYKLALIFGYFTFICGIVTSVPRIICSYFVIYQFASFESVEQSMILPVTIITAIAVYKLSTISPKADDTQEESNI